MSVLDINNSDLLSVNERNKMAATFGLLLTVIDGIFMTLTYSQVGNAIVTGVLSFATAIVSMILWAVFATRIRKANGGYFEFRQAFAVIFIMILISTSINFLYGFIYKTYIDPDFAYKMKTAALQSMERMKMPESKLDEMSDQLDKQLNESKKFNLQNNLMALFGGLAVNSLFGLIVALIVKKKKPMFD